MYRQWLAITAIQAAASLNLTAALESFTSVAGYGSQMENRMKTRNTISGLVTGRALALIGLIAGFVVPGFCEDRPVTSVRAEALTTNARWLATGNLNIARIGHTATLLANG